MNYQKLLSLPLFTLAVIGCSTTVEVVVGNDIKTNQNGKYVISAVQWEMPRDARIEVTNRARLGSMDKLREDDLDKARERVDSLVSALKYNLLADHITRGSEGRNMSRAILKMTAIKGSYGLADHTCDVTFVASLRLNNKELWAEALIVHGGDDKDSYSLAKDLESKISSELSSAGLI